VGSDSHALRMVTGRCGNDAMLTNRGDIYPDLVGCTPDFERPGLLECLQGPGQCRDERGINQRCPDDVPGNPLFRGPDIRQGDHT